MRSQKPFHHLSGQAGFMTADFLFATLLVGGMFAVCFTVCLTLSMAEAAQYISFASARVYYAGHASEKTSRSLADTKFRQLLAKQPFLQMFAKDNSLFSLTPSQTRDFNSEFPQGAGSDSATFIGARAVFRAKALEFRVPFWGNVVSPSGNGFVANVSSYLSREPSSSECRKINEDRYKHILALPAYSSAVLQATLKSYRTFTDNGC